jgi:hypothetical protein
MAGSIILKLNEFVISGIFILGQATFALSWILLVQPLVIFIHLI